MVNKDRVKNELIEKLNNILKSYGEPYNVDSISIMNTSESVIFLGNLRVFNKMKVRRIMEDIERSLDSYGKLSLRKRSVVPCCTLPYTQVSFNIAID